MNQGTQIDSFEDESSVAFVIVVMTPPVEAFVPLAPPMFVRMVVVTTMMVNDPLIIMLMPPLFLLNELAMMVVMINILKKKYVSCLICKKGSKALNYSHIAGVLFLR